MTSMNFLPRKKYHHRILQVHHGNPLSFRIIFMQPQNPNLETPIQKYLGQGKKMKLDFIIASQLPVILLGLKNVGLQNFRGKIHFFQKREIKNLTYHLILSLFFLKNYFYHFENVVLNHFFTYQPNISNFPLI